MDLHSLPRDVFNSICRYLNDESIARMREVNKDTKALVDDFIINIWTKTQTTAVAFSVYQNDHYFDTTQISFSSRRPRDFVLWRIFFNSALSKFDLQNGSRWNHLVCVLLKTSEEVETFLQYLKPLIRGANIEKLDFTLLPANVARACFNFLKGKCAPKISIILRPFSSLNLIEWVDPIREMGVRRVELFLFPVTKDSLEFLATIADIVDFLKIEVTRDDPTWTPESMTVSVLEGILSKKCSHFAFYDPEFIVSLADAEQLVQSLHHHDKKVSFKTWSNIEPMEAQIGEYQVVFNSYRIAIDHLDGIKY